MIILEYCSFQLWRTTFQGALEHQNNSKRTEWGTIPDSHDTKGCTGAMKTAQQELCHSLGWGDLKKDLIKPDILGINIMLNLVCQIFSQNINNYLFFKNV